MYFFIHCSKKKIILQDTTQIFWNELIHATKMLKIQYNCNQLHSYFLKTSHQFSYFKYFSIFVSLTCTNISTLTLFKIFKNPSRNNIKILQIQRTVFLSKNKSFVFYQIRLSMYRISLEIKSLPIIGSKPCSSDDKTTFNLIISNSKRNYSSTLIT